jgi:RHS repeat-associated protein
LFHLSVALLREFEHGQHRAGVVAGKDDAGGSDRNVSAGTNSYADEPGGTCTTAAPAAGSGCVTFEYDGNGAESKRTFPGGATVTITRDASGRTTRTTAKTAAGIAVSDVGYSFSADGSNSPASDRSNIQRRTSHAEVGIAAGAVTNYAYDSLDRLTSATETAGLAQTAAWAYAYDNAGNRTTQTRVGSTGAPAGTTAYTYNTANQLITSTGAVAAYTYDAAGNQTRNGATGQAMTFNTRQAVTKISATTYASFGPGNATTVSRANPSATFGTTSQGLTTQTTAAGASAYTRTPGGGIVSARLPGANASYFILDSLGSVVGIFDKTGAFKGGYAYSPYGELRSATNNVTVSANPIRYIGGYFDSAVNLYKLGARYYDTTTGRFTQMDPTGQEPNPYSYSLGDPINNSDPSGTSTIKGIEALVDAFRNGWDIADLLTSYSDGELAGFLIGGVLEGACLGVTAGSSGGIALAVSYPICAGFATIVGEAISIAIDG